MSEYVPDPRHLDDASRRVAAHDPLLARSARYSRWDGSQTIPDVDADDVMDALSEDLLSEGDLAEALRRLMERGIDSDDPT